MEDELQRQVEAEYLEAEPVGQRGDPCRIVTAVFQVEHPPALRQGDDARHGRVEGRVAMGHVGADEQHIVRTGHRRAGGAAGHQLLCHRRQPVGDRTAAVTRCAGIVKSEQLGILHIGARKHGPGVAVAQADGFRCGDDGDGFLAVVHQHVPAGLQQVDEERGPAGAGAEENGVDPPAQPPEPQAERERKSHAEP